MYVSILKEQDFRLTNPRGRVLLLITMVPAELWMEVGESAHALSLRMSNGGQWIYNVNMK